MVQMHNQLNNELTYAHQVSSDETEYFGYMQINRIKQVGETDVERVFSKNTRYMFMCFTISALSSINDNI